MKLPRDLPSLVAFEDLAEVGEHKALSICMGPMASHVRLTYQDLAREAAAAAAAFTALGFCPGQRVALLMPPSARLIFSFFGALYSGLVPAIVAWPTAKMDPEKYRRNVVTVVASLGAEWLITNASTAALLGEAAGKARVVDPAAVAVGQASEKAACPRRDGTAFIQFSGGTTGTQKSVPISYAHLTAQLETYAEALALSRQDRIISWLPLYHDMGLIACLLLPFAFRLPVTLFAPMEWVMDPRPFLQAIGDERASLCWLPNFAFSFLAQKGALPTARPLDLSPLRAVINCSEPVRPESMDAFFARFEPAGLKREALHACYAMAEATFAVTQTTAFEPPRRITVARDEIGRGRLIPSEPSKAARELVSCGKPLSGVEVRIMEDGAPAAPNHIGEIWIRGSSVMEDYLDVPGQAVRAPREAFTDGFYRTGDLGAFVDGHLYVTGRKKDLIIIGGVNIYPEDIETAVSLVDGIHAGRVVALGLEDERLGTERLVVVAETSDARELERAPAIEAEVRKAVVLAAGVSPSRVFIVPPQWIVKSTAGKIARADTQARLLARWDELVEKATRLASVEAQNSYREMSAEKSRSVER